MADALVEGEAGAGSDRGGVASTLEGEDLVLDAEGHEDRQ